MKTILTLFALFIGSTVVAQDISGFEADFIELQTQGSGGTIGMGETAEIARFRLSNRADKAIALNRIRFRNYGTADLDESFENFQVQTNLGQRLPTQALADRNYVTFTFKEVFVDRGDSVVLSIVARLIYAQSGETVELGIRREEDVQTSMVGLDYFSLECRACEGQKAPEKRLRAGGIYIRSTSPYWSSTYRGSARRVSAASYYNRSYRPSSRNRSATSRFYYRPAGRQTYAPGSQDIQFFSTYINSKVDTQVEGLFLEIASGSLATDKNGNNRDNELEDFSESFSDFSLWVNNRRVDSSDDFVSRNGQPGLLFNSTFEIPANAQLMLTGRISNQAVNGDKVRFTLGREGLIDPIYLYSGDSVQSNRINGGNTSNFRTTTNTDIEISR